MKTILFQGDSITDAGRTETGHTIMGTGYPALISGSLGAKRIGQFRMVNKGISGNRIVDLYARIKPDILDLKPDYLSVLIGVNDVLHEYLRRNGVDADKFYKVYALLIEEILKELPEIRIMILEPFLLRVEGTIMADHWEDAYHEIKSRAAMAKAIAERFQLTWIPLQEPFEKALDRAPAEYWLKDGVHPTTAGHELIKRHWMEKFFEIM